jgi:hypothetical protein
MTAHWVVIAAAALTTLVAAAVAAALAAFAGQALPQAVRHDLVVAPGTALTASGSFYGANVATTTDALRSTVGSALPGVPFGFWQGIWSNPLGLVPGALPARPAGVKSTPLLEAASLDGIQAHAVLVSGSWPAAGARAAGDPIPAALPATAADLLKLRTGDTVQLQDRSSGARLTFTVTGLYAQRQLSGPAASYWQLSTVPASGSVTASGFTTYGPLAVAPSAFSLQLAAPASSGRLAVATGTWVAQPDMSRFSFGDLSAISADVSSLTSGSPNSAALSSVTLSTSLPTVLADTASNLAVARSLLAISGLQLIVLALAALIAIARLLSAQREGETALLTARGATRWQLTRLTAAEMVPLSVLSALLGGAAGVWLARILGSTLEGGTAYNGVSPQAAGTWLDAMTAAVVIAVLAIGAMLFPVMRQTAATAARASRGRQAVITGATRAGADLALIALAVLAGWQLRRYSAVTPSPGGGAPSIDPVLALAPALALAGGTVLTLRLLPLGARAVDGLAARGRGLTSALAGWQFSRMPLRQGGAALLLVMAVATGTLALAQHASWSRSAADQAAFTTGGDVRVDLAAPLSVGAGATFNGVPGVTSAMAAAATVQSVPAGVLAIDSAKALPVVRLRPDEAPLPASRLFAAIAPESGTGGKQISGRPVAVGLTATLSRAPIGTVTAVFTVTDADGAVFQLPAQATLPADGRPHVLTAALGGRQAAYPLRLTQVTVYYTVPQKQLAAPVELTIGGATAVSWNAAASSGDLDSVIQNSPESIKYADPDTAGFVPAAGGATLTFDPGFGAAVQGQVTLNAAGAAPAVVPAIANQAFVDANKTRLGSSVNATVNGVTVPLRIVAVADTFPTVAGSGIIVDLPTLQAFLVTSGTSPLNVTQYWLTTRDAQVPPLLARALPPGAAVTSRVALTATTLSDPLSAAPQQALLAMTVAAVLLAVTGFWVSIAADVRQRRAEHALLAALGVSQRSAAARLFLEKLLLSVPSAVLGLVLGTVVARLLVPAVTLTATAQTPVPPADTLFDLPQAAALALVVAVLPALAAALVVFRRPDPAAELRAAEAP